MQQAMIAATQRVSQALLEITAAQCCRKALGVGFGRIVGSEIEAPRCYRIWYKVDEWSYNATVRPSPTWRA